MQANPNVHVLTLDLRDDAGGIAAYREHHERIWPEVVSSLRRAGVREMDIYLLAHRLVMIVELEDGLDVQAVFARHTASSPIVAQWEGLMKSLQQPVPGARQGEWWARMEPVFRLTSNPEPIRTS